MKKTVIYLLAAMLLVGSASAAPAQAPEPLTSTEANNILDRISGTWTVDMTSWSPDSKTFSRSTGKANVSTDYLEDYTHEQYTVSHPDGKTVSGESFIRYCDEKNRFEVVQLDNSGNGVVMMVGTWYPQDRSLVFRQAPGQENEVNKSEKGMVFRYVFLEDGSVAKLTHKLNKRNKYFLASVTHFNHQSTARQ